MACKVNILSVRTRSLLSIASDSTFCDIENVSRHSAALVSYTTNTFRSRLIVSTDGKCEIVQDPLYGAT